jgi:hypothetical protein
MTGRPWLGMTHSDGVAPWLTCKLEADNLHQVIIITRTAHYESFTASGTGYNDRRPPTCTRPASCDSLYR